MNYFFKLMLFLVFELGVDIFHTNSQLFRPWLNFRLNIYWFKGYLILPKCFRLTLYMFIFDTIANFHLIDF